MNRHLPIVKNLVNESDTQAVAESLAKNIHSANVLIELQGDLGTGKTTLVRFLLQALGIKGKIKSPTYAIVETYEVEQSMQKLKVWHFDFYRFNDAQEWEDAGFRDIFATSGLKLVEWPEKAAAFLPHADLVIRIDLQTDENRTLTLTAQTPSGQRLIEEPSV